VNKRSAFAARGYFFKPAAMLTVALGFCLHSYRIVFGDEMTLRYVLNPTTDALLLIPMTYAAVTGILIRRRVNYCRTRLALLEATAAHVVDLHWRHVEALQSALPSPMNRAGVVVLTRLLNGLTFSNLTIDQPDGHDPAGLIDRALEAVFGTS
jgi:hypothetical protein